MTVFICIDDNNGMMFNNRRQSRDSAVVSKIVEMSNGGRLFMNGYSSKLFDGIDVLVCENFMEKAESGDFCFAENISLSDFDEKIKTLVLFKWNKIYPSDKKMDILLDGRTLEQTFDFEGSSHDIITCEVWSK